MKNHVALLFFTFLYIGFGHAQSKGTLRLHTVPPIGTAMAKVGHETVTKNPIIQLDAGTYEVTVWAPYYGPVKKEVTIYADSTVVLEARLSFSEEVLAYREARNSYNRKSVGLKFMPYATTALFAVGSTVSYIRAKNHHNKALDIRSDYERSVDRLEGLQDEYAAAKEISDRSKVVSFVLSGITIGCAYWAYKGRKKLQTIEEPVLPAQYPPFQVEGIGARFSEDNRPVFSLTLNF